LSAAGRRSGTVYHHASSSRFLVNGSLPTTRFVGQVSGDGAGFMPRKHEGVMMESEWQAAFTLRYEWQEMSPDPVPGGEGVIRYDAGRGAYALHNDYAGQERRLGMRCTTIMPARNDGSIICWMSSRARPGCRNCATGSDRVRYTEPIGESRCTGICWMAGRSEAVLFSVSLSGWWRIRRQGTTIAGCGSWTRVACPAVSLSGPTMVGFWCCGVA